MPVTRTGLFDAHGGLVALAGIALLSVALHSRANKHSNSLGTAATSEELPSGSEETQVKEDGAEDEEGDSEVGRGCEVYSSRNPNPGRLPRLLTWL